MEKKTEEIGGTEVSKEFEYYNVINAAIAAGRIDVAQRILDLLETELPVLNYRIMSDLYAEVGDCKKSDLYETRRLKLIKEMVEGGMYSSIGPFTRVDSPAVGEDDSGSKGSHW